MNPLGNDSAASSRSRGKTRRDFFRISSLAGAAAGLGNIASIAQPAPGHGRDRAQIAISLDLEMARNFPTWNDTEWDYQKGNLNVEARRYAVEAARRVKAHGGVVHFFLVGQALEQPDVDWLKQLHADGHPIGNHTYDHVFLLATKPEDIQFKFKRSPWLIQGKTTAQVLRENVQLCTQAMGSRLGFGPDGFRTPGGFENGLTGRADIQQMLLDSGFKWVSARYPRHSYGVQSEPPTQAVLEDIVRAQVDAQPFVYPTGLVEVPMSPISDVGAFRNARWRLDDFLRAIGLAVDWAIQNRGVFDFLAHPSVLYPNDPEFKTIELICDRVRKAGDRAALVDLHTIAKRAVS